VASEVCWTPESPLNQTLDLFSGDINQSVQALKETGASPDSELQQHIEALIQSLVSCRQYCSGKKPVPLRYPFTRAERQVRDVRGMLFPSASTLTEIDAADSVIEIGAIPDSNIEKINYGCLEFPRLLNGLWQLSSPAWGSASAQNQDLALKALVEAGLTATDMADHYVRLFCDHGTT
jgi:hypothetical protein